MKKPIDIQTILAPLSAENPSGEDLRYDPIYDDIKEARRADDLLDRGDWQRELKTSDWNKVVSLASKTLQEKSKDLQVAVWLAEGLIHAEGFSGLAAGLEVLSGLLEIFWDSLYPPIEDDDLDYRVGPLEFFNDKVWIAIKEIPLTDPDNSSGFSWLKWQESRTVGYENDTLNQYGDVDDRKKEQRDELIREGKTAAEDFDVAVARSSKEYYRRLAASLETCRATFNCLDGLIDTRFGLQGPSMADLKSALDDCALLVTRIFKEKLEQDPDPAPVVEQDAPQVPKADQPEPAPPAAPVPDNSAARAPDDPAAVDTSAPVRPAMLPSPVLPNKDFFAQSEGREQALWEDAGKKLMGGDVKAALEQLFMASCTATSVREKNRYRLLIAKLCLNAERADLARPILEELFTLIEEFQLERWESPVWVAELIEALYRCLTSECYATEDPDRAAGLLTRLCTIDITKAMIYRT